jgi:hypothetical protein
LIDTDCGKEKVVEFRTEIAIQTFFGDIDHLIMTFEEMPAYYAASCLMLNPVRWEMAAANAGTEYT